MDNAPFVSAPALPLIALVGNPNAGKSALFNALTGARQRIGNYPGVTVERKVGRFMLGDGRPASLIDLPGAYSLIPDSLDEAVTRDVVLGRQSGQSRPDAIVVVVDAANLDNHLRFALELIDLGLPVLVALNMIDLAERDGLELDVDLLCAKLGVPVIPTVAVRGRGLDSLKNALAGILTGPALNAATLDAPPDRDRKALTQQAHQIARQVILRETPTRQWTRLLDDFLLHPIGGVLILFGLLFIMFQAVFAWSEIPMGWIEAGLAHYRRRWVGDCFPAADFDIIFLHIVARIHRLHDPCGLCDGPDDDGCGPIRAQLYTVIVILCLCDSRHHGDANDYGPKRPVDDDIDRAADDLFRPAAGIYRHYWRVYSRTKCCIRYRFKGVGAVWTLCRWNSRRNACGIGHPPQRGQRRAGQLLDRNAALSMAPAARYCPRPMATGVVVSAPRGHDYFCLNDTPLGDA
jgi:small GTP-binding protein